MQVKRRVVHVPPDPASLVNPVLAAVSDRLREKWKESGLGLVALAEEINFLFDDMGGFNKDNLLRVLHGGLQTPQRDHLAPGLLLQGEGCSCLFQDRPQTVG